MQTSIHKPIGALILALTLILSLTGPAFAAPGDLDPTFGTDGKVTTSFPIAGWVTTELQGNFDRANAAVLQPDGKMIVVGDAKYVSWSYSYMGLARYNADGSLDTTFGTNGKVTDVNLGFYYGAVGNAVTLLSDGRIAVAGQVSIFTEGSGVITTNAVIALFTSSGTLDTTFNGTGFRTFDYGGDEKATSIAVQSDGKIVAGIYSTNYSANNFILVRCNTNGTLDSGFDTDGVVTTDLGATYTEGINALTTQTISGVEKIIAVGSSSSHSGDFAVLRYNITDGALDTTFGTSGKTLSDFGVADSGRAVAIQSDGKIVVAGSANNGVDTDFALARYTANGVLDDTFDTDGKAVTDFAAGNDIANAVLIQSDGNILASGLANDKIGLARYTTSGTPDTNFGTDGKTIPTLSFSIYGCNSILVQASGRIITAGYAGASSSQNFLLVGLNDDGSLDNTFGQDFAYTNAEAYALALQSDGKIVVAGTSVGNFTYSTNFALARYNADGSLDTSFSDDGRATISFGNMDDYDQAVAVAVQTDGKIVVAGYTGDHSNFSDLAMARFNTDGSLDTSFGTNGLVKYSIDKILIVINDLVIQPDGKIILAGTSYESGSSAFMLTRYTPGGVLDTAFGNNGVTFTNFTNDSGISSITTQSDGKIVAAGSTYYFDDSGPHLSLAMARYTADGVLDTDFGTDGLVTNDDIQGANSAALQPDGKIVAAGSYYNSDNDDFALARYNTDGSLDSSFNAGGVVYTDLNTGSNDSLNNVLIQTDGRIVAVGGSYSSSTSDADFALVRYTSSGGIGYLLYHFRQNVH